MGKVHFGDRFMQFGSFRMGAVDDNHFSISHNGGQTIQIFRSDGTLHPGPRRDFGLWHRPILDVPLGISFGDRFVQLGKFRVGDVDGTGTSPSRTWMDRPCRSSEPMGPCTPAHAATGQRLVARCISAGLRIWSCN